MKRKGAAPKPALSNHEQQYIPSASQEAGWIDYGVTPKVTDLSWDRRYETTFNARQTPLKEAASRHGGRASRNK
eukprot:2452195-Pyramimonas_sp.AAC.1